MAGDKERTDPLPAVPTPIRPPPTNPASSGGAQAAPFSGHGGQIRGQHRTRDRLTMAKETRFRGLSWETGTRGGKQPERMSFLPKEALGKEARPGAGPRGGSPQPGL